MKVEQLLIREVTVFEDITKALDAIKLRFDKELVNISDPKECDTYYLYRKIRNHIEHATNLLKREILDQFVTY